ncbi:RHS repeat-associated core domain-containing protein [Niveispirillum irakense]|uniref:RHS repeat-associated core domain-containing protein n=1 Tax=Niveispirillum irakense TaxID=34011 RepID=UPI001376E10C|nr:RHS repeat-associated core domain-containing protein [Niveispirillum irakense]
MDTQNRIAQMVTLRAYSAPSVPFLNFTTSFQYDANGNMTHDGTTSFAYDNDNQLISANGASLSYDAVGRLYEVSKSGVTTRFIYDGNRLIGELNTNNGYLRRYVHGTGVDEPLVWLEGDSVWDRRWLLTDERGSVIAEADRLGNVVAINTYDEYGKPGSGNRGRFQYTGQVWLAEVGLYYYKARVYSPTLGRFLQPDPIGYADGMNLYAYVGGDPIGRTDPTGMVETIPEIVVVGTRISFGFSIDFSSWGSPGRSLGGPPRHRQPVSYEPPGPDKTPAGPENNEGPCPKPPANRPIGQHGVAGVALSDPLGMIIAANLRGRIHNATRQRYGRSGTDDESDAYRHFYGAFALGRLLGPSRALAILNANEVQNGGGNTSSINMDTYNNWLGVTMSQNGRFTGQSVAIAAEYAIENSCLQVAPQ